MGVNQSVEIESLNQVNKRDFIGKRGTAFSRFRQ